MQMVNCDEFVISGVKHTDYGSIFFNVLILFIYSISITMLAFSAFHAPYREVLVGATAFAFLFFCASVFVLSRLFYELNGVITIRIDGDVLYLEKKSFLYHRLYELNVRNDIIKILFSKVSGKYSLPKFSMSVIHKVLFFRESLDADLELSPDDVNNLSEIFSGSEVCVS